MATYKTPISGSISSNLWTDTAASATEVEASSSSINVHQVRIINTANSVKLYLKLYNLAASSLTVGSNSPEAILPVEAGGSVEYSFDPGMAFGTALCYAVVTTNGTAGTTAASNAITIELATS
tara:strand:+ start:1381 stop:1749 length:369 start_codon:yes stop_codon:yes gene_type:complete